MLHEPQGAAARSRDAAALFEQGPAGDRFFWVITVLCTTVGETASDFLNVNFGLGLGSTAVAAGACLLVVQLRARKYVPGIYWLAVVLISVFGTLITDILTDSLHLPLEISPVIFSVALGLTFAAWYAKERTLSIHSIVSRRREVFYWLAILFTFALGTATGDLMAEKLGLGYLLTGLIVLGVIACAGIAWRLGLNAVLAFWITYILTRPLGASVGDYLSQAKARSRRDDHQRRISRRDSRGRHLPRSHAARRRLRPGAESYREVGRRRSRRWPSCWAVLRDRRGHRVGSPRCAGFR